MLLLVLFCLFHLKKIIKTLFAHIVHLMVASFFEQS